MYQIRQDEVGIFLGNFNGIDIWTKFGLDLPTGIHVYKSFSEAVDTVNSMINSYSEKRPEKYPRTSFHIETVDKAMDTKIIKSGLKKINLDGWEKIVLIRKYYPEYCLRPFLN